MGCGGSKPEGPKLCNQAEMAELCTTAAKEMMVLCSKTAVENADTIESEAPPEITDVRKAIARLRDPVANFQSPEPEPKAKAKTKPKAKAKGKGLTEGNGVIGTMVGGAKDLAADVTATGKSAMDAAVKKSTATTSSANPTAAVADALETLVDQVAEPFKTVSKDILKEKGAEIAQVLNIFILNMEFPAEAVITMVRGAAPYGIGQLGAVPQDSVTQYLCTECRAGLAEKIKPIFAASIEKNSATSAWSSVVEKFQKLSEQVDKLGTDVKLAPASTIIMLDINDYIVNQTIEQLGIAMGKEEFMHRSTPRGKTKHPAVFEDVFGGAVLDEEAYGKHTASE